MSGGFGSELRYEAWAIDFARSSSNAASSARPFSPPIAARWRNWSPSDTSLHPSPYVKGDPSCADYLVVRCAIRRLSAGARVHQNAMMLLKGRLADGGLDVETALIGPAVFLDVWPVREMSRDTRAELRTRFAAALVAMRGSLLASAACFTELETLTGRCTSTRAGVPEVAGGPVAAYQSYSRAEAAREARDEIGAYLSEASLNGYVLERSGELLRSEIDPHSLSEADFFDLGRPLAWTAADPGAATTAAAQSQALKDGAKARAEADRDEQRRDRTADSRLYPRVAFTSSAMLRAHNAVWREVTRRSLWRTWMRNDGFDVAHVVPALAIGGLIAVDGDWKDIGQVASADLPRSHATFYRPGELEHLVADLETRAACDPRADRAAGVPDLRTSRTRAWIDLDDWLQAERELLSRWFNGPSPPPAGFAPYNRNGA